MKFDEWFRAQYGPEPSRGWTRPELIEKVQLARQGLEKAEGMLEAQLIWESRQRAALMAWVIKDEDKT